MVSSDDSESGRFLQLCFPDQRHSRKNGIYMFNNSVQQLFLFPFFGLSGFVHVRGGGGWGV